MDDTKDPRTERLAALATEVWKRAAGKDVTVAATAHPFLEFGTDRQRVLYMARCTGAPAGTSGNTAEEAMRWLVSWGVLAVGRRHGADDPAAAAAVAGLRELGMVPVPGALFPEEDECIRAFFARRHAASTAEQPAAAEASKGTP